MRYLFNIGPGSGSSNIQKRLSMKATSLIGDTKRSASGDENQQQNTTNSRQVSVSVDVVPDRRMNSRTDKTSVKSNKSDTSEV